MAKEKADVVRRNIEFQPASVQRIEKLRTRMEAASDSEVLRRALQILDQLVEDEEAGKRIFVREPNGDLVAVRIR